MGRFYFCDKLQEFLLKLFQLYQIGLIFVFNLIVGTGALTLPAVIAKAGWLLGMVFIILLAFISYMTVTFVIETMACANAVIHWRRLQFIKRDKVSLFGCMIKGVIRSTAKFSLNTLFVLCK